MSVALTRYLMASNIPAVAAGSRRPVTQRARCSQLTVLDAADRASLRTVRALRRRAASVHLVPGSNFVPETVYTGRFSCITQVIQTAHIRTVQYIHTHTYKRTVHTYI